MRALKWLVPAVILIGGIGGYWLISTGIYRVVIADGESHIAAVLPLTVMGFLVGYGLGRVAYTVFGRLSRREERAAYERFLTALHSSQERN